ncbi:asparagine synthase (glutamine-hydrolyzing) [Thalassospira xiamenensis]|uniref:asparagine synthase (glutamine-hydrolyzing) n=1 Tax=Thalassospira xiamenensis TaxID=220697 RepID=UPI001E50B81E|nr:asparagine synthase (glutamine-hydrolyzing) [Thalassospira xiamenensis]
MTAEAYKMGRQIKHRGPDSDGVWGDETSGLAFSHQRLAIMDLSPLGHQPMVSSCERFVICYNGEVYNAGDLRQQLPRERQNVRGHSDTEIILECFAEWSVEKTVPKMIGMFAFSLWDRKEKVLWLVRDRLGIKPLYWSLSSNNTFLFGSEITSLEVHRDFDEEVNFSSVSGFMRFNYVPGPDTIFENVYKLMPGCMLRIGQTDSDPEISAYWSVSGVYENGLANPFSGTDAGALIKLEELITDSVERRMISDVPLGAFLSGGVDSSCVSAVMQKLSGRSVKTFSIGFTEEGYNEAVFAKSVASHLGTDHTEFYVSEQDLLSVVPKIPSMFDEPFSDSSQIPTYIVSGLARSNVTVALSGDGGDELFAGYDRYGYAESIRGRINKVPYPLRKMISCAAQMLSEDRWDQISQGLPTSRLPKNFGHKVHKFSRLLTMGQDDLYCSLISHWETDGIIPHAGRKDTVDRAYGNVSDLIKDPTTRMQMIDLVNYLPGDILTKVDRVSMAVGLEARVPLLDHRIVEFAAALPANMKIRDGQSKWLLKQLLYKYVPRHMVDRPKMGFGVPIGRWIRGPLKEWAEDLLSPEMFTRHALLAPGPILKKWEEHKEGKANWEYLLWDVLMLHAWAEGRSK